MGEINVPMRDDADMPVQLLGRTWAHCSPGSPMLGCGHGCGWETVGTRTVLLDQTDHNRAARAAAHRYARKILSIDLPLASSSTNLSR